MNYARPKLADLLAAQFVLGTLRGAARRRFERLIGLEPAVTAAVREWEDRLLPLAHAQSPREPSARVWTSIETSLFGSVAEPKRSSSLASWGASLWSQAGFWRAMATASFAGLAVLGVLHEQRHDELFPQTYVAVLADRNGRPAMVVSAKLVAHVMTVKPLTAQVLPPGRVLELWAMPASGGPPKVLGIVASDGIVKVPVHPSVEAFLAGVGRIAVSVEPSGGSPSGQPTGAVVFEGPLLQTS